MCTRYYPHTHCYSYRSVYRRCSVCGGSGVIHWNPNYIGDHWPVVTWTSCQGTSNGSNSLDIDNSACCPIYPNYLSGCCCYTCTACNGTGFRWVMEWNSDCPYVTCPYESPLEKEWKNLMKPLPAAEPLPKKPEEKFSPGLGINKKRQCI